MYNNRQAVTQPQQTSDNENTDLNVMDYNQLKTIAESNSGSARIAKSYYLMAQFENKSAYRKDNLGQANIYGYKLSQEESREINTSETSRDPSYGQNALRNVLT